VASSNDSKKVTENDSTSEREKQSFWTGGRVAITVIVAGLIIWYGIARYGSDQAPTAPVPVNANVSVRTQPPVNTAPAASVAIPSQLRDTTVQTLDGGSLKLSDFSDKVVVLNMWATWCGPCRMEMPELIKMSNEYKSQGLVVLGLATTYNEQDDPQRVKDYVKQQNIPYKIIWDDGTLSAPLVQAVQGRSVIPQSFVISRDGRIVKHFTGFNPSSTPGTMRQVIEEELNNKGKA
jgi:thiol-disulfide isomerase/thioredoxin